MEKLQPAKTSSQEVVRIQEFLDMIAPSIIKFNTDYFICGNSYRCVWALRVGLFMLLWYMQFAI